MPKHPNSFSEGLNRDISDLVIPSNMMRNCKNMRMLDLDGTSYALTTIKGTEFKFNLTAGYEPIASVQYGNILYIMSATGNTGGKYDRFELGSFNSPIYPGGGENNPAIYAPFHNLDDAAFNVDFWDIEIGQFVDLGVQPDYDGSVNIIITTKNNPPRIVNSGFNKNFEITERREGANTNDYTSSSVDGETRLILRSQQVMNIAYGAIESGGKLQPGNYVYIFRYATADFNETDVVNQSGICSVFEGYSQNTYSGSINVETTKRVRLVLSNVDTDFAYLKVYFKYNRGDDSNLGNVYELTQPIAINGRTSFDFVHDGFEETVEVSEDSINLDFTAFDSVATHTQANSYLILGNVKEAEIPYQELLTAAQTVTASTVIHTFTGDNIPYGDPENVYNYMSHFSAETYPYGIVFILQDGSTSPVFPIQGYDNVNWSSLTTEQQNAVKEKGLYRFEDVENSPFFLSSGPRSKGLTFNINNIPQSIKDETIGFFVVRGERKPDLISQGIIIPTFRVPPFDYNRDPQVDNIGGGGNYDGNYYKHFLTANDYKNAPIFDGLYEAWVRFDGGSAQDADDWFVLKRDGTNAIDVGYMPSVLRNFDIDTGLPIKDPNKWAYYSADFILNEARYITALQRPNIGYRLWNTVNLEAVTQGTINQKWKVNGNRERIFDVDTSLLYKFRMFNPTFSGFAQSGQIDTMVFVPDSTFSTGHDFISGISTRLAQTQFHQFEARSLLDAYFGMELTISNVESDAPYQEPFRTFTYEQTDGPAYANVGTNGNKAYLLSIYPRLSGLPLDDINQLYDSVDGVIYRQIGDRMTWAQAGTSIDVYGGDCYIGEVHKKLNRSGYADPKEPSVIQEGGPVSYKSDLTADNINQGLVFSFLHECEYNHVARLPYLANTADSEDRTFFPYKEGDDFNKFRAYRLQETNKTNQGHSETERPKSFVPIPSNTPFIAQNFFTRLIHSEKHVPNAFQNGYRSFIGVNHEDYDPDMGEIVSLLTHRDQVFVVFEHGIAVGPVSERIQTGSDSAGAIFVEPSGVLPPNLAFASREIGAQHGNAIIQTPSCVYGIDQDRRKIWQFREGLLMISDAGMQSVMEKATLANPRLGYDPHYHEVIFTTDDWTLCFKEGLERFTSFYSFQGQHYSRRVKDFYSFNGDTQQYDIHNVLDRQIYGNIEESYVEVVFNPASNMTKVLDYLELVSNEIAPQKIDLYTYNVDTYKEDVLDESKMFQHVQIQQGVDVFTQENRIKLRDRRFIAQIPNITYINDVDWSEGRFRNKYAIVRLTYETTQKVEVLSIITDFRISVS